MDDSRIIIEEDGNENWETYQPELNVIPAKDCIQIRFTKKSADAVNIYRRQPGNDTWEFIATAVNSPFDDHESETHWEYCIRGVKENKEVGIPAVSSVLNGNFYLK